MQIDEDGALRAVAPAQRRVAELNASAEDAVRQGRDAADFRARTSRVQAYMSALKAIQRMLGTAQDGES